MPEAPSIGEDAAPSRVAFLTMVRDEAVFLPIWINHCARMVSKRNIFILFDGFDQTPPADAEGCQSIFIPNAELSPGWERRRWEMLSDLAASLLSRFDVVVVNDVDELIVADPAIAGDPLEAILQAREAGALTPFGVEMIHRTDLEPADLDTCQPILAQRRFARVNFAYSKPCILGTPVRFSAGGHKSSHPVLTVAPALYLFHLRFADRRLLLERQSRRHQALTSGQKGEESAAGIGWSRDESAILDFLASFIEKGEPIESDFRFDWQRKRMVKSWAPADDGGVWRFDKLHNRKTYRIPDRFLTCF